MKKFLVLIVSAMLIQPNILFAAEGKKMTRSDICKKNYEKLFNSDWNPNVGSDPEMMAILQKYIFGEVFTVGNLDMKTREMLTVTSLAVQRILMQLLMSELHRWKSAKPSINARLSSDFQKHSMQ